MEQISFLSVLESLLIGPVRLLLSMIFTAAYRISGNTGVSIIVLSLAVNLLVLPLYNRADAIQKKARDTENRLRKGISHIKKTFSGDEKIMMLQTYYRQNGYKPTDALGGSLPLLLEIPFFIAAYEFISQEPSLIGVSFGPVKDLSRPDGILVIGSIAINIFPVIMTLLNVISAVIYTKGFPLKTKLQTYGLAAFFLVFLYNSPSGLAFYWTLNNLFSLGKNIVLKLSECLLKREKTGKELPLRKAYLIISVAAAAIVALYNLLPIESDDFERTHISVIILAAALLVILTVKRVRGMSSENQGHLLAACALFMALLPGLLIPSSLLADSPQEFYFLYSNISPMRHVVNTFSLYAGIFLIWLPVFYKLFSEKAKRVIIAAAPVICAVSAVNYFFFDNSPGNLNADLNYEHNIVIGWAERHINELVLIAVIFVVFLAAWKWRKIAAFTVAAASAAFFVMSAVNIADAIPPLTRISENGEAPRLSLSSGGKNVVIIVLDRAIGPFVPSIFKEKPELKEKFDGFTYYSNTLSYGPGTNTAMSSLAGGYEYTPYNMNARDTELLVDKHNEALRVMPVLFGGNGYNVTVTDPSYANYQWIPDTSIYDDYPYISAFNLEGRFNDRESLMDAVKTRDNNFFFFSMMKLSPSALQPAIYNSGKYFGERKQSYYDFLSCYNVLKQLPEITDIAGEDENNFLFMFNNTTHNPVILQEPEYEISAAPDNTAYDEENTGRFTVDGNTLDVSAPTAMPHYETNMAVYLSLGEWFDYLRENGAYDNTRIIIVSDHGFYNGLIKKTLHLPGSLQFWPIELYMPLLMVKDFGSAGFSTSDEFMTNADVSVIALDGIVDDPVNPFTGNPVDNSVKFNEKHLVCLSTDADIENCKGTRYMPYYWAEVSGDVQDAENWHILSEME